MGHIPRLTYENRLRIKELLDMGLSVPDIAREIGVHHETIYQELKRCEPGQYDPEKCPGRCRSKVKKAKQFSIGRADV